MKDNVVPFSNLMKQANAMKQMYGAEGVIIMIASHEGDGHHMRMGVSDGLNEDIIRYMLNIGIHNTFVIGEGRSTIIDDGSPAA